MIDSQMSLMFFLQIIRAPSPTVLLESQVQVQYHHHHLTNFLLVYWSWTPPHPHPNIYFTRGSEDVIGLYTCIRQSDRVQNCGNFWQYYAQEGDDYAEKTPDYAEISKTNKVVSLAFSNV